VRQYLAVYRGSEMRAGFTVLNAEKSGRPDGEFPADKIFQANTLRDYVSPDVAITQ
jgi:hypothetical protein